MALPALAALTLARCECRPPLLRVPPPGTGTRSSLAPPVLPPAPPAVHSLGEKDMTQHVCSRQGGRRPNAMATGAGRQAGAGCSRYNGQATPPSLFRLAKYLASSAVPLRGGVVINAQHEANACDSSCVAVVCHHRRPHPGASVTAPTNKCGPNNCGCPRAMHNHTQHFHLRRAPDYCASDEQRCAWLIFHLPSMNSNTALYLTLSSLGVPLYSNSSCVESTAHTQHRTRYMVRSRQFASSVGGRFGPRCATRKNVRHGKCRLVGSTHRPP